MRSEVLKGCCCLLAMLVVHDLYDQINGVRGAKVFVWMQAEQRQTDLSPCRHTCITS